MTPQIRPVVATILYVTRLVALFEVRNWRHCRATGTSGFNGFGRRDG